MIICILEKPGKILDQMLNWLTEESAVDGIYAFENEVQFLERISSLDPDLCLIRADWRNLNGLRIAEVVKQNCPDSSIIMLSETRDYAVEAFEVGAQGYLVSPLERKKFIGTVFWRENMLKRNASSRH
jgi:two-component SAPR family response regulator